MTENSKELKRLKDLYSYDILDTPDDPIFDQITALGSSISHMPICLISLIDANRQWFKSSVGLAAKETPRNISFCTYAIEQEGVFEICDATKDERFKNNPLVQGDPNIRYYAGAPLKTPAGHHLGTLCVIDNKPNHLSESQIHSLKILAQQVVDKLELKKMNRELSLASKKLEAQQELLVKKAKVQTIGELTSGICHQINNPLAIIVGHSMILKSLSEKAEPESKALFKRELEAIEQTTLRISEILTALRTYSKDLGSDVSLHSLDRILDDVAKLIKGKLSSLNIALETSVDQHLNIEANRNQIMQVLLNLISNASEALEKAPEKSISVRAWGDDKNVYIDVMDSGPGIEDERGKVFEAFYSTKSRHFGIGLSNAQSYVEENGGELSLFRAKEPTTFRMRFPKAS